MIDIQQVLRDDGDEWRRAVDARARPVIAAQPRGVRRPPLLLTVSAAVVAAALAGILVVAQLASDGPTRVTSSGAVARDVRGLERFTWSDPHSPGTAIFGRTTVNLGDGCSSGLRALQLDGHSMTIGALVGQQSTCSGTPGAPTAGLMNFDAVLMHRGRLRWSIDAGTLNLTSDAGRSLALAGNAPAVSVTGQRWALTRIEDRSGNELNGSFGSASFFVRNGQLRASDLCAPITADVTVTPTKIIFSHVVGTKRRCSNTDFPFHAAAVIDSVLHGTRTYSIYQARQLVISGPSGLLIYSPAS